jgi:hypothetical protein
MVYHNDILLSLKWKIAIDFSWGSSWRNDNEKNKNKINKLYIYTHIKVEGGKKKRTS